jgi:hypothetical protein
MCCTRPRSSSNFSPNAPVEAMACAGSTGTIAKTCCSKQAGKQAKQVDRWRQLPRLVQHMFQDHLRQGNALCCAVKYCAALRCAALYDAYVRVCQCACMRAHHVRIVNMINLLWVSLELHSLQNNLGVEWVLKDSVDHSSVIECNLYGIIDGISTTHAHPRTHAPTQARSHARTHAGTHAGTHARTHAGTHAGTHARRHARTHARRQAHMRRMGAGGQE